LILWSLWRGDGARTRDLYRDRAALNEQAAAAGKGSFEFKTVPQGAATSVWAAVVASAEQVGGRYCENCHVSDVVTDDAPLGMLDEGVRGYALDPQNAAALWKKSEEMIGEVFA
jgi:mono/diheme cytochrome c family protein